MRTLLKSLVVLAAVTFLYGFAAPPANKPVPADPAKLDDYDKQFLTDYPKAHAITYNDVLISENKIFDSQLDLSLKVSDLYDRANALEALKLPLDSPKYIQKRKDLINLFNLVLVPMRDELLETRGELQANVTVTDKDSFTDAEYENILHFNGLTMDLDILTGRLAERLNRLPLPPKH